MIVRKIITGLQSSRSKQIVVAKYKEKTSWIHDIHNIPYIIYDKYDKTSPHYLPNIPKLEFFSPADFKGILHDKTPTGRESHTYLYHIIKNYDQLADINIFLQGNPYEIRFDARDALKVLAVRDFEGVDFLPLTCPLVICDHQSNPLHRGLSLKPVFERLFQNKCPDLFAYSWGAMFCVSKEVLLKRPLAFYEEMMQIIYEEPLSGYIYERLWPTILACNSFIPHPTYPKVDRSLWGLPGL